MTDLQQIKILYCPPQQQPPLPRAIFNFKQISRSKTHALIHDTKRERSAFFYRLQWYFHYNRVFFCQGNSSLKLHSDLFNAAEFLRSRLPTFANLLDHNLSISFKVYLLPLRLCYIVKALHQCIFPISSIAVRLTVPFRILCFSRRLIQCFILVIIDLNTLNSKAI